MSGGGRASNPDRGSRSLDSPVSDRPGAGVGVCAPRGTGALLWRRRVVRYL